MTTQQCELLGEVTEQCSLLRRHLFSLDTSWSPEGTVERLRLTDAIMLFESVVLDEVSVLLNDHESRVG